MSYSEIGEQFDLPRLHALNAYHKKYPPTHILVAAYMGAGEAGKPAAESQPDLLQVLQQFPQGGGG